MCFSITLNLQLTQTGKSVLWLSHLACYHSNTLLEDANLHMQCSFPQYLFFLTWIEPLDFSEGCRQEKARGLGTVLMQNASRRDWELSGPESLASIQRRTSVKTPSIHRRKRFFSLWSDIFPLRIWEIGRRKREVQSIGDRWTEMLWIHYIILLNDIKWMKSSWAWGHTPYIPVPGR